MTTRLPSNALQALQREIREALESRYGPLMGSATLASALGLPNATALRQARRRGHVTVAVFTLPGRRGVFALTRDVADWLAKARLGATDPLNHESKGGQPPSPV